MTTERLNQIAAHWARLGVMFGLAPTGESVDLERLLLDTARAAPANSRLLVMAVTWLARHGETVAKHRLAAMIRSDLELEHQPAMGLLLDLARASDKANHTRFDLAIRACQASGQSRPLSDLEANNRVLWQLARRRASPLSRKWGRWIEAFALKSEALRPVDWVVLRNPGLYERALASGDLAASIVAECEASSGHAESEAELAHRCGASRPAIRSAIRSLERAGRVQITRKGRRHAIELRSLPAVT